jgi:hypothetical protein
MTFMGGWVNTLDALGGYRRHLIPVGDSQHHRASSNCECQPEQDLEDASLFLHNAFDQREGFERGERKVS